MWCSRCRIYPLERELDVSGVLTGLEDRLRRTLSNIERRLAGVPEEVLQESSRQAARARSRPAPPRVTVTSPMKGELYPETPDDDERIFKYIEAHDGEISVSKALGDLGMSLGEFQDSVGRLRSTGRLSVQSEFVEAGMQIPVGQRLCVNCSRPIELEAKYCAVCGYEQPPSQHR